MPVGKWTLACALALVTGCGRPDRTATHTPTPQVVTTSGGIEMIVVPAGSFEMGSDQGADDEQPVHTVSVDSFLMDVCEVTQDQLLTLQISDPSHFKRARNPAEQINWTTAAVFCNDRSRAEGFSVCYDEETWACDFTADGYRLPTEAEWEYACRAGTRRTYSFGDRATQLTRHGWFKENARKTTHEVGQKAPNPWGLYDMHGNVAEWCNDFHAADYYRHSPTDNPRGPSRGKQRVVRGGSWKSSADSCRSSYRASSGSLDDTCLSDDSIGFRCVRRQPASAGKARPAVDSPGAAR